MRGIAQHRYGELPVQCRDQAAWLRQPAGKHHAMDAVRGTAPGRLAGGSNLAA